jgi:hypothetical protein
MTDQEIPTKPVAASTNRTPLTLPYTGKIVYITARRLKGLDLINARRLCKPNDNAADMVFSYALWACVLETQAGKKMVVEDLLDMDSVDISKIGEVLSEDSRFQQSGEAEKTSTPPSQDS